MSFSLGYYNLDNMEQKNFTGTLNAGLYLTRTGVSELIELFQDYAQTVLET
jgi:hypothetical protein